MPDDTCQPGGLGSPAVSPGAPAVTFAELRDTRFDGLAEAAEAWRVTARQLDQLKTRMVQELIGPLRTAGRTGTAADQALRRLDLFDGQFELAALQCRVMATVLGTAADRLGGLQMRLRAVLAAVGIAGMTVDDSGTVRLPPAEEWQRRTAEGRADRTRQNQQADAYHQMIGRLVAQAGEDDLQVRAALERLQPARLAPAAGSGWADAVGEAREAAALLGLSESAVPKPGTDPLQAGAWWQRLGDNQRQLYLSAYPQLVGVLDGLPAVVRDQANRLALQAHLGELRAAPAASARRRRDLARSRDLLDRLKTSGSGPAAPPLLLLGVDNADDGKAIVAVGNPDTARHTAVVVPGPGAELATMRQQIDHAMKIKNAADVLTADKPGGVATIAWLGYDAPGPDDSTRAHRRAEAGAQPLGSFVNGLHAAHEGGPSHTTVIGHSYGSAVVDEAARRGDGLAVDDIITVGGPGIRIDRAGWPRLDPQHFHLDPTAPTGDWGRDSRSLYHQAAVVMGRYELVELAAVPHRSGPDDSEQPGR